MTLYRIPCFRVDILKNCSMFSMSQCFSIFSIYFQFFFDIFGQKGRLNFNFRTNFTLLIKNRKPNMRLNVCLLWTIFCYLKMFEKIATLKSTLKHGKHWIEFNVEILKNIDIALSFNVHFFDIENIESKSMSMSVQTLISHTFSTFCALSHTFSTFCALSHGFSTFSTLS